MCAFFFLRLLKGEKQFLENQEHLSAIRAFAAMRLDTWKTFAETTGAKSFPLDEFLPEDPPQHMHFSLESFVVMCAWEVARVSWDKILVIFPPTVSRVQLIWRQVKQLNK